MNNYRTIRPCRGRMLIAPEPSMEKTPGGLHIPDVARDPNNIGGPKIYRVIAVGGPALTKKGAEIPMEVGVGDRIVCHSYTTGPMNIYDDTGRMIISQDEVLAVLPAAQTEQQQDKHHAKTQTE